MIGRNEITKAELKEEIDIYAIAINNYEVIRSLDRKVVYPEILFYGDCRCNSEHGICIGFHDKKFLGEASQGWTL